MADDEKTGHQWERLAGHDFREDIPPSFEWWRKFVYEPAHQELVMQIERNRRDVLVEVAVAKRKVDGTMRLLWSLLAVNITGLLGILGVLLARPITH